MKSISIIFPAFNEAENIRVSIERAVGVLEDLGLDFEVIVVDDGSSDATRLIAERAQAADPRIRAIHHLRNRGYGAALKTGILAASKELIFFTDADLQFDLSELDRLLANADRYDVIAGYRARRSDPLPRRLNAWAWGRLIHLLFDLDVRDIDCAFKLFHRHVFERIPITSVGAFVNSEILVRARAAGFSLFEVPVSHYPRVAGTQSGANPRVIAKAFVELSRLHDELNRLPEVASPEEGAPAWRDSVSGPPPR